MLVVADREGFEPSNGSSPLRTFQARAFSLSATCPLEGRDYSQRPSRRNPSPVPSCQPSPASPFELSLAGRRMCQRDAEADVGKKPPQLAAIGVAFGTAPAMFHGVGVAFGRPAFSGSGIVRFVRRKMGRGSPSPFTRQTELFVLFVGRCTSSSLPALSRATATELFELFDASGAIFAAAAISDAKDRIPGGKMPSGSGSRSRISARDASRWPFAEALRRPCFQALRLPFGAPRLRGPCVLFVSIFLSIMRESVRPESQWGTDLFSPLIANGFFEFGGEWSIRTLRSRPDSFGIFDCDGKFIRA